MEKKVSRAFPSGNTFHWDEILWDDKSHSFFSTEPFDCTVRHNYGFRRYSGEMADGKQISA
jgi:hypothetical protein